MLKGLILAPKVSEEDTEGYMLCVSRSTATQLHRTDLDNVTAQVDLVLTWEGGPLG